MQRLGTFHCAIITFSIWKDGAGRTPPSGLQGVTSLDAACVDLLFTACHCAGTLMVRV
jgi:hypothetical protein